MERIVTKQEHQAINAIGTYPTPHYRIVTLAIHSYEPSLPAPMTDCMAGFVGHGCLSVIKVLLGAELSLS